MDRIAIVTGGAGGLGTATAKMLAAQGYRVVVADLSGDAANAVARELPAGDHFGLPVDVTNETSVIDLFDAVESKAGPVSALVNYAGVLGPSGTDTRPQINQTSLTDWENVFRVNATGSFLMTREMGRRCTESPVEHGRIVLVSSAAAQVGGYQANSAYIASKGAVLSFTKAAAREYAAVGVTVNALAPGAIDTEMLHKARGTSEGDKGFSNLSMLPLGRIGDPREIAAAAAFLLSIDAGYITGATLDVNGGLRMQ